MERTLLLNATYEPLRIIPWQKAITLLCQGKVEVVAVYDREIHGVSVTFRLPSVLRLLRFIRVRSHHGVKFSRANIFARDGHRCQYCGRRHSLEDLTFDHVIPIAKGGGKSWENIVTACMECNRRKGGRTPEDAGLRLVRKPDRPRWRPVVTITLGIKQTPESWRDYLYWNVELDAEPG
ncbi:MAG: HNH endonuclease [Nitrospirae bacterium]|nr:HNH endonuclease [Nitrospirota bacterium]